MNNSGKRQSFSDQENDDQQQSNDDSSPVSISASVSENYTRTRRNGNDNSLVDRLSDLFVGDDSDLLMQRNTVFQWIQALDMQVMGACRADERLKPLLKLNVSSVAENRLLFHLSQHFEPSEVGLLARYLCIPLVSVRVGKINKQGTLLIPTSARGNLVLSLLPTSDLRISFLADDGYVQRLSILRNTSDCSSVLIEGISADTSGRSFAIKVPNSSSHPFYFWCSEKSILLGNELLQKMKNFLERKPSLAELTGISDSRLQHFVDRLRTYLVGLTALDDNNTTFVSRTTAEIGQNSQSSKPSRLKNHCSLSPRPSSFKEGLPKSLRNVKLRRRATEGGRVESFEKHSGETSTSNKCNHDKEKLPESSSPGTFLFPSSVDMPPTSIALTTSLFSPYYCWCPPSTLQLQYTSSSSSITLPPPNPIPNLSEIPPFLPLSMPVSQQIPMFMCDPIVHVPVIDICSSGQGQAYLVSAANSAMSVTIQETTDSEKSARDTLRILLSGSSKFPSVLANTEGGGFYGGGSNVIAAMGRVQLVDEAVDAGGTCSNEDGSDEDQVE